MKELKKCVKLFEDEIRRCEGKVELLLSLVDILYCVLRSVRVIS